MKYRYIFSSGATATTEISNYRLLDKQKMQGQSDVLRVEIPDDAKIEKWECDEYSTWSSSNKRNYFLCELNPKICVKINGRWTILEDATEKWLNGMSIREAIEDNLRDQYSLSPTLNAGYVTWEQYAWMQKNPKISWRFKSIPSDLTNIEIPELTPSELETLDYIRKQFNEYCEEIVNDSPLFEDYEKQDAQNFLKNLVNSMSTDDLAYEWHRVSITSLDPCKRFETKELVDKMRKSKYAYVYPDHYKYAIEKMIDNLSFKYDLEKYRDKDDEEKDFER